MPDFYPNEDLDLSLLNEIADGSDAFIVESIDLFLQQTPELLQLIDDSMEELDWAAAASSAHKLKPTLGFFGMLNAQALIQDVESGCKAGAKNPYDIIAKLSEAKAALNTNTAILTRIRTEAAARL